MNGAADAVGVFEWEGGSLDEMLGLMGEAALTVKIEAVRPGSGQQVGNLDLVAGGVLDSAFGEERGDTALASLKRIPGLRFRIRAALPHPEEGTLEHEGPSEGAVSDRPVTALMRYCEEFVLTCALEISRGTEHARISYRRGEILRTLVDGSEAPERLPDVIGWTDGQWKIVLPQLNLPRTRKAAPAPAVGVPPSGTLFGFPAPVIPGRTTPASPSPSPPAVAEPEAAPTPAPRSMTPTPPAAVAAPPLQPMAPAPSAAAATMTPAAATPIVAAPAPTPQSALDLPTLPNDLLVSLPPTPIDVPVVLPASLPPPPTASPFGSAFTPAPAPAPLLAPKGASAPIPRPQDDTRATPPPRRSLPMPTVARSRPAPRRFTNLPLVVHVLLGVVLGAAIVAGYWAYLALPPGGIPGLLR
jgi:hypothetical protein